MNGLRILVNAWLIALLCDGALRVLTGLVDLLTGSQALGILVAPFEVFAVLGGLAVWWIAAVSSRVPVRVVLPPMLALAWMLLGALPFSVLFYNGPGFQISIGLVLVASVGASEMLARTVGHGRWLLRADAFGEELQFTWKRLLGWLAGWWLGGPVAATAYLVVGISWTVWWGSSGFLLATPSGVSVAHKAYVKGDDTVDLVAMIHLGEEGAYDQLFAHIPTDHTLVLAEGIHDREGLLTAPRNAYGKAASAIGLTVQAPAEEMFREMDVQNADVDVSDFDPLSVELLNVALGMYAAGDNPTKAVLDYLGFWQEHRSDARQVQDQLFQDILFARNDHLLGELDAALDTRDRVVLPWGALHMVGVSRELEDRGWTHTETHRVVLIRWATLLGRS